MVTNKQFYLWERKKSRLVHTRLVTFSPILSQKAWCNMCISPGVNLASGHGREFPLHHGLFEWTSASTSWTLLFLTSFCPSLVVLPHLAASWGPGGETRVIAQFTANTCLWVLPQPLIQIFLLPPLLTLVLWSLSPELTFIIQLEITPSSCYQLPWEP